MATLLIDILSEANLYVTNTDLYDLLLLGQAPGSNTNGRVVSAFGYHMANQLDSDLESYSVDLKKNGARLTVTGNYRNNPDDSYIPTSSICWTAVGWRDDSFAYGSGFTYGTIDPNYNLYHLQFNDDYVSGAIKFAEAKGYLHLSAQSGATRANEYNASGDADRKKTDDGIAIRSDSYGIFSQYSSGSGTPETKRFRYAEGAMPTAPGKKTEAHTIYSNNTVTVTSDLAGSIDTNTAALHAGYYYKTSDNKTALADDTDGNSIIASGVTAGTLKLDHNFRATIASTITGKSQANDEGTFGTAVNGSTGTTSDEDLRRRVYRYHTETVGNETVTVREDDWYNKDNGGLVGTSLFSVVGLSVTNNTIATYGIKTNSALRMAENTVWAGSITAKTEKVLLAALHDYYLAPSPEDGKIKEVASATITGDTIAAYGIYSGNSITISSMGGLKTDDNGVDPVTVQNAYIYASASNITVKAQARDTSDKAASVATMDVNIVSAAIYGNTVTLGSVSKDVTFESHADNISLSTISSSTNGSGSDKSKALAYGIYAVNKLDLADFNGQVTVTSNNFSSYTYNLNTVTVKNGAVGIGAGSTLTSSGNLKGTITVTGSWGAMDMYAKSITVQGVIDSTLNASAFSGITFGVYAKQSVSAAAFTGTIGKNNARVAVGINVDAGTVSGDDSNDLFDIAGTIYATKAGISTFGRLNVRVSGTIVSSNFALRSELGYDETAIPYVGNQKYNDMVDIVKGANVTGHIDLGALTNTVKISSGATVNGALLSTAGLLNLTFNLEKEVNAGPALTIDQLYGDDKTLMDSSTMTVNLNYASVGTYTLLRYEFNAEEYWKQRQISFWYQGANAVVTLNDSCTGNTEIVKDNKTVAKVSATMTTEAGESTLTVTIEEKDELTYGLKQGWEHKPSDYITQSYDAKNGALTLDWTNPKTAMVAKDFGLTTIALYEIEYQLYDESNNERGSSISAIVDGTKTSYAIKGVENNTKAKWRIRLLGDDSSNIATAWSEWSEVTNANVTDAVTTYVKTESDFGDLSKITSAATDMQNDANEPEKITSAVSNVSWDAFDSALPIRNYEVQFCVKDQQIKLDDAQAAGYDDIESYIAKGLDMPYSKIVTGESAVLSYLGNQGYGYWKVRAIDTDGWKSDWVAGKTFRVWTNPDGTAPVFNTTSTSIAVGFELPKATDFSKETMVNGVIGWNGAIDTQSGVRYYQVERSTDGWKTYEILTRVDSEMLDMKSFATWDSYLLDSSKDYRVVVGGKTSESAYVRSVVVDNETIPRLTWIGDGDFNGKNATVQVSAKGANVWKNLATLTGNDYQYSTYQYTAALSGLTGAQHDFRVIAYDYFGNVSEALDWAQVKLDKGAPVFINDEEPTVVLDVDKVNNLIKPTFTFSRAKDTDGDIGVRYYRLSYRPKGSSDEWSTLDIDPATLPEASSSTYELTLPDYIAAQIYEYKIEAVDWFGGSDTLKGSFGTDDLMPPSGNFTSFDKASVVGTWTEETDTYWEYGEEIITVKSVLSRLAVTLKWKDTFVDQGGNGVVYTVTLSDNERFIGNNVWSFETTTSSLTLDGSTVGRPSAIFAGLSDVYYMVSVADKVGNKNPYGSDVQSFSLVDSVTGEKISFDGTPAAPKSLSGSSKVVSDGRSDVTFRWADGGSAFGVDSYTLNLTYLTPEGVVYDTDSIEVKGTSKTLSKREDGIIQWSVTANSGAGKTASTAGTAVVSDATCPVFNELNSSATPGVNKFTLQWSPASDVSGIDHYVVWYGVGDELNKSTWQHATVAGTSTSYQGNLFGVGTYNYQVYAVDTFGNESALYQSGSFEMKDADSYANMVADDTPEVARGNMKAQVTLNSNKATYNGDAIVENEWVGPNDQVDYRLINVTRAGNYQFVLDGVSAPTSLVLYDNTGMRRLALANSNGQVTSVSTRTMLLDAGEYFISVTATNAALSTGYNVRLNGEAFVKANKVNDNTIADASVTPAAQVYVAAGTGAVDTYIVSSADDEWVGFGDSVDYRQVTLEKAGNYVFTLDGVGAASSLVVYDADGRRRYAFANSNGLIPTVSTRSTLLEAGTYYVAVTALQANWGRGTGYTVRVSGEAFVKANKVPTDNTLEEAAVTEAAKVVLPYDASTGAVSAYIVSPADDEWVGFGDAVDYRQVTIDVAGNYTFTLDGVTAASNLVVYDADGRRRYAFTNSNGSVPTVSTRSALLDKGIYYVAVTAMQARIGSGTGYTVLATGEAFVKANKVPTDNTWEEAAVTEAAKVTLPYDASTGAVSAYIVSPADDEWVGFGDAVDYRQVTINVPGRYTFTLDGVTAASNLVVYDAEGRRRYAVASSNGSVSSVSTRSVLLDQGIYYVAVTAMQARIGKGTGYSVQVTGDAFVKANQVPTDNTWEEAAVTSAAQVSLKYDSNTGAVTNSQIVSNEWVGYGDSVDYRQVFIGEDGSYAFTLRDVTDNASLVVYDSTGQKRLAAVNATAMNPDVSTNALNLTAGTYYVSVTSPRARSGGFTGYNVDVTGTGVAKWQDHNDDSIPAVQGQGKYHATVMSDLDSAEIVSGWVGFNDSVSFRELELAEGDYTFATALDNAARMNLYSIDSVTGIAKTLATANGREDTGVAISQHLAAGTYYLEMEATQARQGKNTGYAVCCTSVLG